MLRVLVIFILFLIVFAGIILFLMQEPGFAIFNYGNLSIEITLVKFAIGLFIVITFIYVLSIFFLIVTSIMAEWFYLLFSDIATLSNDWLVL